MLVWYSRHHVCAYHVYVITGGGRRVTAMLYVLLFYSPRKTSVDTVSTVQKLFLGGCSSNFESYK